MSINKATLVGNVGADPKIRTTQDGREIANFSLATTESWKDKNSGERRDKIEWHRVVIFSQGLVGIVKNYVKKGSKLYLEGNIQTRKWTDNNGVEKYTTEIVLQNYNSSLQMLDARDGNNGGGFEQESNNSQNSTNNNSQQSFNNDDIDDDIPF